MKAITEEVLVDYLAGELSPADRAVVTTALAEDAELFGRLTELEEVLADIRISEEPELPVSADDHFAAMLATAVQEKPLKEAAVRTLPVYQRPLFRRLAAAATVLLIFALGYQFGTNRDADQLSSTRTLMLELMDNQRPSERIRATTVTFDMQEAEPGTIRDLGYLLRNDASANVRLAALDALKRFSTDPSVADLLLEALNDAPPEVVRFELIETLVRLNDTRLLPYLHDIMDADSLPQPVRDAAEMASFKLI